MKRRLMKTMVFVAIGVALSMPGEVDPYDESVKRAYDYSNWCGRTRMDYPRLVQDWYLPDLSLPTNGLKNVTVVNDREVSSAFSRLLVANQDRELLRVDTRVCTGAEEAHEAIIRWFSRMTKPFCYPQVTNDIGDVLFYRHILSSTSEWGLFCFVCAEQCVCVDTVTHAVLFRHQYRKAG